jgi:hypothetical protein
MLERCREARPAEHAGKRIEAEFAPELIERPDIAKRERRLEANLWCGIGRCI